MIEIGYIHAPNSLLIRFPNINFTLRVNLVPTYICMYVYEHECS